MNGIIIWIVLNVVWWVVSISLGNYNIDINPFLDDTGEIISNSLLFLIGLAALRLRRNKEVKK